MSSDERWIKAVAKLIELTQTDKLVWERTTAVSRLNVLDQYKVDVAFLAEYESHNLRLYEGQKKVVPWTDDHGTAATLAIYTVTRPGEPYWRTEQVLETIDGSGIRMYCFPRVSAIDDLYRAVIAKTFSYPESAR